MLVQQNRVWVMCVSADRDPPSCCWFFSSTFLPPSFMGHRRNKKRKKRNKDLIVGVISAFMRRGIEYISIRHPGLPSRGGGGSTLDFFVEEHLHVCAIWETNNIGLADTCLNGFKVQETHAPKRARGKVKA